MVERIVLHTKFDTVVYFHNNEINLNSSSFYVVAVRHTKPKEGFFIQLMFLTMLRRTYFIVEKNSHKIAHAAVSGLK
jgi:hypothetical protein